MEKELKRGEELETEKSRKKRKYKKETVAETG